MLFFKKVNGYFKYTGSRFTPSEIPFGVPQAGIPRGKGSGLNNYKMRFAVSSYILQTVKCYI